MRERAVDCLEEILTYSRAVLGKREKSLDGSSRVVEERMRGIFDRTIKAGVGYLCRVALSMEAYQTERLGFLRQ